MNTSLTWNSVKRVVVVDPSARTRLVTCRVVRRLGHMPIAFNSMDALCEHGSFEEEVDLALITVKSGVTVEAVSITALRALLGRSVPLGLMVPGRNVYWVSKLIRPGVGDEIGPHLHRLADVFAYVERLMVRNGFPLPAREPEWGPFRFSLATGDAWRCEQRLKLTPLEFDLAIGLFHHQEKVLTREWLYAMFWGQRSDVSSRSLDVHVSRVRRALDLHDGDWLLHGISRHGYVLRGPLAISKGSEHVIRAPLALQAFTAG